MTTDLTGRIVTRLADRISAGLGERTSRAVRRAVDVIEPRPPNMMDLAIEWGVERCAGYQ